MDTSSFYISIEEKKLIENALDNIAKSKTESRYKFKLNNGLLETIIANENHPSRPALLWQNVAFGTRSRKTILAKKHLYAENPILSLYPQILDDLKKYIKIPNKKAYEEQLKLSTSKT